MCVAACLAGLVAGCRTRDDATGSADTLPHLPAMSVETLCQPLHVPGYAIPGEQDKYAMIVIKPDPRVDYKILEIPPDPTIDYKIIERFPESDRITRLGSRGHHQPPSEAQEQEAGGEKHGPDACVPGED